MDKYFESNNEIFCECVLRWEKQDSKKIRSLYVKDLNIARTLLLWIYPPFLEEYDEINRLRLVEKRGEPVEFPGFGRDNYATQKNEWERSWKKFLSRWNIKMRTEEAITFTHLEKIIYPILFAKVRDTSHRMKFIPCSDYPTPARALSKGHERTMSRIDDHSNVFPPYEVTLTIDTRWTMSDISNEISKYVKEYQRLHCERIKRHRPNLSNDEILGALQKTLHPNTKTCPQKEYYEFFYQFAHKKLGYQEIANLHKLRGDQARGRVKKAIKWVIKFLDYDFKRGEEWAKHHIQKP